MGSLHFLSVVFPFNFDSWHYIPTPLQGEEEGASIFFTCLAVTKSFVGPAVLYLPHGVQQAGLLLAPFMLLASWTLCMYGATRLLQCWRLNPGRLVVASL